MARVKACVAAVVTLLLLDFVWLYVCGMGDRFTTTTRRLTGGGVQPWPVAHLAAFVACAYVALAWGLCEFALLPSLEADSPKLTAAAKGAVLGAVIYGVYDATNLAVFGQGYSWKLALADAAWGTTAFGAASLAGAALA
jgi:uncharacterized membrane protein